MTNLRKALLCGVAIAVMGSGAHADELSDLKAQLESLQARVDSMNASTAALPEGTSLVTFRRGSAEFDFKGQNKNGGSVRDAFNQTPDQGFTIGITPTADMPAPVAEITVSGYVSSWLRYDFDGHTQGEAGEFVPTGWTCASVAFQDDSCDDHLSINSRGSVSVRSKVDTAIGQIRTFIELRADAPATAEMRYAWGEWDMTPNWTFGAGSYFEVASLISAPNTINSSSPVGPTGTTRRDQIRLTYTDGPLSWAVALEEPTYSSSTTMPDITTSIIYDVAGGHQFQIIAGVADWDEATPAANDELGWLIGGGMILNLADVATLTAGAAYGEGLIVATQLNGFESVGIAGTPFSGSTVDAGGDPLEAWGMHASLTFAVNETTSVGVFGGYEEILEAAAPTGVAATDYKDSWVVGGNIIWKPVKQMQMGWEINYGEAESYDGTTKTEALQGVWGTTFYF